MTERNHTREATLVCPAMSAQIIPFRVPKDTLEGEEREAALAIYREGVKPIAFRAVYDALNASYKIPGVAKVPAEDLLPLLVEAMRRELDRSGL
jgi:hypothetical protein